MKQVVPGPQPSPQMQDKLKKLSVAISAVQKAHDADLILFNGPIGRAEYYELLDYAKKAKRHPNVVLLLATYGGDPHAAYRMARCLKDLYAQFTVFIIGLCKSAGTLLALGADEIIIADSGELGPLDIQLRKQDEMVQAGSGLDTTKALEHLSEAALDAFRNFLVEITVGTRLPTRLASQIATDMTIGLFGKIYEQIDPVRLGEIVRATNIAMDYGQRLSHNLKENALERLVHGYHAHAAVIDRAEAQELFKNARPPDEHEKVLADLFVAMREPEQKKAAISLIEPPMDEAIGDAAHGQEAKPSDGTARGGNPEGERREEGIDLPDHPPSDGGAEPQKRSILPA